MSWIRKHRPSPTAGIALAALVVALGGVAFAAIPDSNGTIHACYQKTNGDLRVVQSPGECRNSEQALNWDQHGGQGIATQYVTRTETGSYLPNSNGSTPIIARCLPGEIAVGGSTDTSGGVDRPFPPSNGITPTGWQFQTNTSGGLTSGTGDITVYVICRLQ